MRVITGSARGVRLKTLDGLEVRPTTERVKEAIFSIIQFELEGRRFLDLFAGSGQMGIEALSRGAARAVFVDMSRNSLAVVQQNLQKAKLAGAAVTVNRAAESYLSSCRENFDVAFLDPPYHKNLIPSVLPLLEPLMCEGGVVICETQADEALPESVGMLKIDRVYRYSQITVTVYRK